VLTHRSKAKLSGFFSDISYCKRMPESGLPVAESAMDYVLMLIVYNNTFTKK